MSVFPLEHPRTDQERTVAGLVRVPAVADQLGDLFARAGYRLYLVGGSVRDTVRSQAHQVPDLDFTTDARPEAVSDVVRGWHQGTWDAGQRFGTVGLVRDGHRLEVTTFRSEVYDRESRKPTVTYGQTLAEDLERRDFTVNAMAVSVPGHEFIDLHNGFADLAAGVLRTPGPALRSFDDDPLRILRAARFHAGLGLVPTDDVREAMAARADRLAIVSAERVRDELVKLLLTVDPVAGLRLLNQTGVLAVVLPEVAGMQLAHDPLHRHKDVFEHSLQVLRNVIDTETSRGDGHADPVLRLAALLHDIGKPATRVFEPGGAVSFHHHEAVGRRMVVELAKRLRLPKDLAKPVAELVFLHLRFHGYVPGAGPEEGGWTDSAVRRYVHDAGEQLERLHRLTRSDCTTRNPRRAAALSAAYDDLEERIERLAEREKLDAVRPDLDGNQIMALLGVTGPVVGRAYRFLLDLRIEQGPLSAEQATDKLLAWAAAHEPPLPPAPGGQPVPDSPL